MSTSAPNEIVQFVTVFLAAVGAVLGVLNTWNAFDRQRVKLVVRPAVGIGPTGQWVATIETINLSPFAVTISEMGFGLRDGQRMVALGPLTNGKELPHRLEPRESVTVFIPLSQVKPEMVTRAFARTSCEEVATGDSPALQQIRDGTSPLLRSE